MGFFSQILLHVFFQRGLRDFFFNRFPSTIFFYNFLLLYRFIAKISSKVVDRFSLRNFLWGFLLGFSGQTQIEKQSANIPSRIICESVFEGKSVYQFGEKIFERTFERKSSNQFLDENLRINFWEKIYKWFLKENFQKRWIDFKKNPFKIVL